MDYEKAVRHLIAAEWNAAVASLREAGEAGAADRLAAQVKTMRFDVAWDGPPRPKYADLLAATSSPARERVVTLAIADDRGARVFVRRSLDEFSLYQRGATYSPDARDTAAERNSRVARGMIREALEKSTGTRMDPAMDRVLAERAVAAAASSGLPRMAVRWKVVAGVLAMLNFALAWWAGTRTFNFLDTGYLLENLHHLGQGRLPYRDFFLCLPPAHYYFQAIFWWLTGESVVGLVIAAAVVQAAIFWLTLRACRLLELGDWQSVVCASLVTVGGVANVSFPVYDIDAGLFFLVSLNLLLSWERRNYAWPLGVFSGAFAALVVLTKLNMGIPFLAGMAVAFVAAKIFYGRFPLLRTWSFWAGAAAVLGGFVGWLAYHSMIDEFVAQTILFPAKIRLSFGRMLADSLSVTQMISSFGRVNHQTAWRLLVLTGLALCFTQWLTGTHRRPLAFLIVVPTLWFTLGSMQSQAYWSLYGIYAVGAIFLCQAHRLLAPLRPRLADAALLAVAALFLVTGLREFWRGDRLAFLDRALRDPAPFQLAPLRGFQVTRDHRDAFEELVAASQQLIPSDDAVFYFPGDAPFYWITDRSCPLPSFQVNLASGYSPEECVSDLERTNLSWLIVRKTPGQYANVPTTGNFPPVKRLIEDRYEVVRELDQFLICRYKDHGRNG